jgi:hypothetical protein
MYDLVRVRLFPSVISVSFPDSREVVALHCQDFRYLFRGIRSGFHRRRPVIDVIGARCYCISGKEQKIVCQRGSVLHEVL